MAANRCPAPHHPRSAGRCPRSVIGSFDRACDRFHDVGSDKEVLSGAIIPTLELHDIARRRLHRGG